MIVVKNLIYTYPKSNEQTLNGLSFKISKSEIFGFLGPSGSGKSTTQKILIGLLKNYDGNIQVMNKELKDWNQDYYENIGVSFELPNHYLKLTALENLEHFSSLYKGEKYKPIDVLEWVDLHNDANKKVSSYSKGMKIRLNVARSIIHQPKLLFLDEPTSGLDPVNSKKVKDLILDLRNKGTTVFITTHDMIVADELCDRVAFITEGNLQIIESPKVLKKNYGKRNVKVEYLEKGFIKEKTFALDKIGENNLFLNLLNSGNYIETIHTQETTLEKVFIEVTGKKLIL